MIRPATARTAAAAVMLGAAMLAAQADPYTGVWVRRPMDDGATQVLTIKVSDGEEDYTSELTAANGRRQVTHYVARYDGREHPSRTTVTEGGHASTRDDTVILKWVDERTRERHWMQGGRIARILRRRVSPDGKVMSSVVVDVDARGQEAVTSTLVFDRK
jgi:hypothetical protein